MRSLLRFFVSIGVVVLMAACHRTADDVQVRKAIAESAAAAEAGHAGDTVAALTDDFDGNTGQLDKPSLANLLRVTAIRGQTVHAVIGPVSVERRGDRRVATFTVTLAAGQGVLPDQAGVYRVDTGWRKDDGTWRCFTASWRRSL
ncbi:hypothetical protein P3W23_03845 [Luteibacter sp. PPL554]